MDLDREVYQKETGKFPASIQSTESGRLGNNLTCWYWIHPFSSHHK